MDEKQQTVAQTPLELCSIEDIIEHLHTRYTTVVLLTDGGCGPEDNTMYIHIPKSVLFTQALGCIEYARIRLRSVIADSMYARLTDCDDQNKGVT